MHRVTMILESLDEVGPRTPMYIRITTVRAREGRMDAVIAALRNQGVAVFLSLPGCRQASVCVREEDQTIAFISLWTSLAHAESATVAHARDSVLTRIRDDITDVPDVQIYKVVAHG
jgi:quinol monooxygenase YgiN